MPQKVSYFKEAIKEPLNIWALVGCVAASVYVATGSLAGLAWVPLAAAAGGEALYLATLPATTAYRRLVDRRARQRELVERGKRRQELIKTFDPREREAVEYLAGLKNLIYQNYKKFARVDTLPDNIRSLDSAWDSFVDFLDTYRRLKNHLRTVNRQTINNQIQQTERSIEKAPDEDTKRLFQKNLDFLHKRLHTYDDIERSVKRVEAQLQSIENFFQLVNDQVITMPTPEHISSLDFESMLSSIELTKEILEETAPLFSQLDAVERSAQSIRPSLAQRQ
jgi:hypothetical protein